MQNTGSIVGDEEDGVVSLVEENKDALVTRLKVALKEEESRYEAMRANPENYDDLAAADAEKQIKGYKNRLAEHGVIVE